MGYYKEAVSEKLKDINFTKYVGFNIQSKKISLERKKNSVIKKSENVVLYRK